MRVSIPFLILLSSPGLSMPAFGATFTVDPVVDTTDVSPGDGVCRTRVDGCSLRAAIQETNALPGPDRIVVPPGLYVLSRNGPDEDLSSQGDLDVRDDLFIEGSGASLSVIQGSPSFNDRILHVPIIGVEVSLQGLTLEGGNLVDGAGGAIRTSTSERFLLDRCLITENHADNGGGLLNSGTAIVTIRDSSIISNTSASGGGGIFSSVGLLRLVRSTVRHNSTGGGGGGLFLLGATEIVNSTIAGNRADWGGAIWKRRVEEVGLWIVSSTITGNSDGILVEDLTMLHNSILAGNGRDCEQRLQGRVVSLGYNLIQDSSGCEIEGELAGILTDVDPELWSLGHYGGPTWTAAMPADSPAVDAGDPQGCTAPDGSILETDQRGVSRALDGDGDMSPRCDLGAVEAVVGLAVNRRMELAPGGPNPSSWELFAPACRQLPWRLCPDEAIYRPLEGLTLPNEARASGAWTLSLYEHSSSTSSMRLSRSADDLAFMRP